MIDFFDPRTWREEPHERRIYDTDVDTYAVVDEEDYFFLSRWLWCAKRDRCGKIYMRRAIGHNRNGVRLRTHTLYLHQAVMERKGTLPLSKKHTIIDHRDGDSLNCRRENLRWVTSRENNIHRYVTARQLNFLQDGAI